MADTKDVTNSDQAPEGDSIVITKSRKRGRRERALGTNSVYIRGVDDDTDRAFGLFARRSSQAEVLRDAVRLYAEQQAAKNEHALALMRRIYGKEFDSQNTKSNNE